MRRSHFVVALRTFCVLSVLTGIIYPVCVYIIAVFCFPTSSGGSLIGKDGNIIGSTLIAQKFTSPRFFHPRPSAGDYATVPSAASHLGPTSRVLKEAIIQRQTQWGMDAPADLLTTSGSGVDPHITPAAALFQVNRVAKARHLDGAGIERLKALIQSVTEGPQFGLLGERRVNVLMLNLAMDERIK